MKLSGICALLALVTGGCTVTASSFPAPVTVSTHIDSIHHVKRLKALRVGHCESLIVIIPIGTGPRFAYSELLEQAQAAGGNAIVDLTMRNDDEALAFPFYLRSCWQADATAALID